MQGLPPGPKNKSRQVSRRLRALVVDDERSIRRLVHRCLARVDFEVMEAANGEAALELARAVDFDLVISDVQMPTMSGIELLARLRVEQPTLPVVILSGHYRAVAGQCLAELGAFAVMRKPFAMEDVQRVALCAVNAPQAAHQAAV